MLSRTITRDHDSARRRGLHRHVSGATFILVFFPDHAHAYHTKSVGETSILPNHRIGCRGTIEWWGRELPAPSHQENRKFAFSAFFCFSKQNKRKKQRNYGIVKQDPRRSSAKSMKRSAQFS